MPDSPFSRIILLGHTGYIGRRLAPAFAKAAPAVPVVGKSVTELDLTRPDASGSLETLLDPDAALVI